MKKATIIVYEEDAFNSMFDALFGDLHSDPDVFFVVEKARPSQGIIHYLLSKKLNKFTFGLSTLVCLGYYNLPRKISDLCKEYDHISVLFHNASLRNTAYPKEMFRFLSKKAKFNLLYLDMRDHLWVCEHANYLFENGVFDKTFTVDPEDAAKYGMICCSTPYSAVSIDCKPVIAEKKLYFCGADAGRMYKLFSIWNEAKKRDIKVEYDLTEAKRYIDFFEGDKNIHFIEHIPYTEMINKVLSSECIIDIVQDGQQALTLRPYEAVVYNKKLITNNKYIKDFRYYNPKYMRYFEKAEDIDWEWISSEIDIDYDYKGDFSPRYLIERLA